MAMDIFIFDIDGTLADCTHRQHYLQYPKSRDWKSFFAEQDKDEPYEVVCQIARELFRQHYEILFFTGRPESTRDQTANWLVKHVLWDPVMPRLTWVQDRLHMRPDGDYTQDDTLKERMLHDFQNKPWMVRRDFLEIHPDDHDKEESEQRTIFIKDKLHEIKKGNIVMAFEDRPRCVRMYQTWNISVLDPRTWHGPDVG